MHVTGKSYVYEMSGMGRKMKCIFLCMTVSGLGLMGVPGLAGFISKWGLTSAAVESGNPLAYIGIVALLLSAILTAIYMLSITNRAFFPHDTLDYDTIADVHDPGWKMCLPIIVCAAATVVLGLFSAPLVEFFENIAFGNL